MAIRFGGEHLHTKLGDGDPEIREVSAQLIDLVAQSALNDAAFLANDFNRSVNAVAHFRSHAVEVGADSMVDFAHGLLALLLLRWFRLGLLGRELPVPSYLAAQPARLARTKVGTITCVGLL